MPILLARARQRTLRPCLVAGEDLEPLGRLLLWRTVPLGRGLGVHGRGAIKRKADRMSLPPIWAQPRHQAHIGHCQNQACLAGILVISLQNI
jgi:hypothetical protein